MALRPRPIDNDLMLEVKHPGSAMFEGSSEEEEQLLKRPSTPPSSYGTRSFAAHVAAEEQVAAPSIFIPTIAELVQPEERVTPFKQPAEMVQYVEPDYSEVVEYDMDSEDDEFVLLVNSHLDEKHGLSQTSFEFAMDTLEKVDKSDVAEIRADVPCSVCTSRTSEMGNLILFCDSCDVAVHQCCYGVLEIPEGPWLCRACERMSRNASCELCSIQGGALKRTHEGSWCHVICALWIPELSFMSAELMEPIRGLSSIPDYKKKCMCSLCKKSVGVPIQCSHAECGEKFHASCAVKSCFELGYEDGQFFALCRPHSLERWVVEKVRALSDAEALGPTLKDERLIEQLTKGKRNKALSGSVLQIVYKYWLRKRIQLGNARNDTGPGAGPALLRRLDVKRIRKSSTSRPTYRPFKRKDLPPAKIDYSERRAEFNQLRRELERARVLLERAKRREKYKRDLIMNARTLFELRVPTIHSDVDESLLPDELIAKQEEMVSDEEEDEEYVEDSQHLRELWKLYEPRWLHDEKRQLMLRQAKTAPRRARSRGGSRDDDSTYTAGGRNPAKGKRKRGRPRGSTKKKMAEDRARAARYRQ